MNTLPEKIDLIGKLLEKDFSQLHQEFDLNPAKAEALRKNISNWKTGKNQPRAKTAMAFMHLIATKFGLATTASNLQNMPIWLLSIFSILLAICHVFAAMLELQWAMMCYPKLLPKHPCGYASYNAAGIGITTCLLASLSGILPFYLAAYFLLIVIDIVFMGMISSQVVQCIRPAVNAPQPSPYQAASIQEIQLFYLGRPWTGRALLQTIGVLLSGALFFQGRVTAAYYLIMVVIVMGEAIVWV